MSKDYGPADAETTPQENLILLDAEDPLEDRLDDSCVGGGELPLPDAYDLLPR
eukprot:m.214471 g.214471  ORF g.214471 m.214471 type:complete len:53 (+) comp54056_c0_seq18:584-742(+)